MEIARRPVWSCAQSRIFPAHNHWRAPVKFILKSVAALSVLAAATLPAFAQDAVSDEGTENVTVFAPYVVKKVQSGGRAKDRVSTVSVSRQVSYSDLDLTTSGGRDQLETRVKQMARDVCGELDRRFPKQVFIPVGENRNCVRDTTAEAMLQVKGVEDAAKS
jgi:UrcA family protein